MHTLTVELGARSYPVLIGDGLLGVADAFAPALGSGSVVVTSETVAALHLDALRATLGAHPHAVLVVPDGDEAKNLDELGRILEAAVEARLARDGSIIALGGGAVGDVAGLAAALYHRGIGCIQVPTTLLAQVDAAVGGKTALNLRGFKNMVGAFHQPARVVADVATLATLPEREFRAGLAEVVKHAVLDGPATFAWLEETVPALAGRDPDALQRAVLHCCRIKARYVGADEREHGDRALLNLGHTFGHALESIYAGRLLHGEAVSLGCVLAARLSQSLGWLPTRDATRIVALLRAAGLPTRLPEPVPDADALLDLMERDKKVAAGRIRLVLLRGVGDAVLSADHPHAAVASTLRDFTSDAS